MKKLTVSRNIFNLSAAVMLLAGCSGSQPIGAPVAMPQTSTFAPPSAIGQRILPDGSFKVLHRFDGPDGAQPQAALIDVKGALVGTTNAGGRYGYGTVYSISTTGTEKVLHSFKGGSDGANPQAPLIDVKGTLYGTTSLGGGGGGPACLGYGCGTVYSISPSGSEKVLHNFTGGSDGASPTSGLLNVDGTLYGTTAGGGSSKAGTVYSISTAGSEKVLYNFAGGADGAGPAAALINLNGTLYGTSVFGGSSGVGTVYSVSTTGSEKVLHSFAGPEGANPLSGLIDVRGLLYGTASAGGSHRGTVYDISTSGELKVLHNFRVGRSDGLSPYGGLIAVKDVLYGTTDQGGGAQLNGTVFTVNTSGSEQLLHRFAGGSGGSNPWTGLVAVDGTLYGTTFDGGSGCSGAGCGIVFALTP